MWKVSSLVEFTYKCNFAVGEEVPIPTFPLRILAVIILSTLVVLLSFRDLILNISPAFSSIAILSALVPPSAFCISS